MLDFNKYELLLDLAETQNITKSAERLGYSQPGASHILKNIEAELGFPVIFREKYGVTLTPAAKLLIPLIQELMLTNEKLDQTIYAIKGLEYGKVTIGAYSSVAVHLLPKILWEFKNEHPNLEIDIREGGADSILDWLDNNMIDFAFISKPYATTLDFFPYGNDPLVAVMPSDYKSRYEDRFTMDEFNGTSFIMSAEGNDFDIHNALELSGVKPDTQYSVLDDRTILSMVENKLGISILTKLIIHNTCRSIRYLPLEPEFHRELGIAAKSYDNLSPAAKTFVDFSLNNIGKYLTTIIHAK